MTMQICPVCAVKFNSDYYSECPIDHELNPSVAMAVGRDEDGQVELLAPKNNINIFCGSCGEKRASVESKFCGNCGASQISTSASFGNVKHDSEFKVHKPLPRYLGSKNGFLMAVLAIIGILSIALILNSGSSTPDSPEYQLGLKIGRNLANQVDLRKADATNPGHQVCAYAAKIGSIPNYAGSLAVLKPAAVENLRTPDGVKGCEDGLNAAVGK